MISHLFGNYGGWVSGRPYPFIGAHLCVFYFFAMSGFVLSYSYNKISFLKYFLLRLAKLWPLMFASTAFMLIVYYRNDAIGMYVSSPDVFKIKTILKNIAFLHGVLPKDFQLLVEPS